MPQQNNYRIIYFSGTGNTEYIAREIQCRLRQKELICQILAADKLLAECGRAPGKKEDTSKLCAQLSDFLENTSVLILAYPTYASDIPKPMKSIIESLPQSSGAKLAVISTCHMAGGDCCILPARKLKARSYDLILAAYVKMPNNLKLPPLNFPGIKNGKDLDKYFQSSARSIDNMVERLLNGEKYIEGKFVTSLITGVLQRSCENLLAKFFYKNMFVSKEECKKCKLCAAACPQGNITFENDLPKFANDCCFCLRCYNFCPVSAIQVTAKTKNTKKYNRYKGFNNWKPEKLYNLGE